MKRFVDEGDEPEQRRLPWSRLEVSKRHLAIAAVICTALGSCFVLPPFCFEQHGGSVCLLPFSYLTMYLSVAALILMANNMPADMVLLGTTVLLLLLRIIDNDEAWRGFSSPSVLTIGALFILARALEETHAVRLFVTPLLGRPSGHRIAILRLCLPTTIASAFLNNTPIVAMLIPACQDVATRYGLDVRALLMPLSFASMLGGMCTLVGTSTNLVLNAQIAADKNPPCDPYTLFEMTPIAVASGACGIAVLVLAAPPLLVQTPKDGQVKPMKPAPAPPATAAVEAQPPVARATESQDGSARLTDADDRATNDERGRPSHLHGSDADGVGGVEMANSKGDESTKAMRSNGSITAADGKDGAIITATADTVAADVTGSNVEKTSAVTLETVNGSAPDHLPTAVAVEIVDDSKSAPAPPEGSTGSKALPDQAAADPLRLGIAVGVLAISLLLSALGVAHLLHLALAGAFIEVSCGCLSLRQALESVDYRVLLTIASSFGLGSALENTHVAALLGAGLEAAEPHLGAIPFLAFLYLLTAAFSCVVSNAATVVLLYAVVRDVQVDGLRPSQTMLVLMLGASSAFMTPIGYQTNLMVQGAGGYRFADFTRLGTPLTLVVCTASVVAIAYAPTAWLP